MTDFQSRFETFVDRLIRESQERGEFDDLPGSGQPLPGAGTTDPPDWWAKRKIAELRNGGPEAPKI